MILNLTHPKANFWFSCGDLLHHDLPLLCFWQLQLTSYWGQSPCSHPWLLSFISPFSSPWNHAAYNIILHPPSTSITTTSPEKFLFTWFTWIAFYKKSLHLLLPPSSIFLMPEPQRSMQNLHQILSCLFKILKCLSVSLCRSQISYNIILDTTWSGLSHSVCSSHTDLVIPRTP